MDRVKEIFLQTVKPKPVEERLDYYLFRPIASLFVPLFERVGLTPNQVTTLSLFTGLFSAYLFWKNYYSWAATVLFLTIVLDCCDGQLARLKNKTSLLGQIWDGVVDHIWAVSIGVGIYFSSLLDRFSSEFGVFALVSTAVSIILHCGAFEKTKMEYLRLCHPEFGESSISGLQAKKLMHQSLEQKRFGHCVLYGLLAIYSRFFQRHPPRLVAMSQDQRDIIRKQLSAPMVLWTYLGMTGHFFVLMLMGWFYPLHSITPLIVWYIIVGVMNVIWIVAHLWWKSTMRKNVREDFL